MDGNLKHIKARLNEEGGRYILPHFKSVIDWAVNDAWFKDNQKYIRPETLFNGDKFDGYLQNATKLKDQGQSLSDDEILKKLGLDNL